MKAHETRDVRSQGEAEFIAEENGWDLANLIDKEDDRGYTAVFYTRPYGYTLAEEGAMERMLND